MNTKFLTVVCWAMVVSVSLAFGQDAFDYQKSLNAATQPFNDYARARTKMIQDQIARQQLLQDQAIKRAFLERQADLQREHELRLEKLRKDVSPEKSPNIDTQILKC